MTMRREKQIAVAFDDYSDAIGLSTFDDFDYIDIKGAFEEGAEWADETMIEKACKWLEQHQEDYNMYDAWRGDYVNFQSLIIDFRKAMEE